MNAGVWAPVGRGAVLLKLDPWLAVRFSADQMVTFGLADLQRLTRLTDTDCFIEHFAPTDRQDILERLRLLSVDGLHSDYYRTPGGRIVEVLIIKRSDGGEAYVRSTDNPLQTLEHLAHFYRSFMNSSDAVMFTDTQGTIIDVNRAFLDMYDYRLSEVIGKRPSILKSGRQTPDAYAELWKSLAKSGVWSGELTNRKRTGEELTVSLSISSVRDAAGETVGYVGTAVDITSRQRMVRQLEAQNERLVELDTLRRAFLSMASHDLKNPIQGILGYVELLRSHGSRISDEKSRRYLERIEDCATDMRDFVNQILDLEKTESGNLDLDTSRVHLEQVLRRCAEVGGAAARCRGVTVEVDIAGVSRPISVDITRMEQVFHNLISNAIKFSPEGGRIRVSYESNDQVIVVRVEDEGPGVPEESFESIFDAFHQVRSLMERRSEPHRGGVGLGLAIVKNIVEMHGGTVSVQNLRPRGCRFTVELPASKRFTSNSDIAALIVDPSNAITGYLQEPLVRHGVSCFVVSTPYEMRRLFAYERPELLFYDDDGLDDELRLALDTIRENPGGGSVNLVGVLTDEGLSSCHASDRTLRRPIADVEVADIIRDTKLIGNVGEKP